MLYTSGFLISGVVTSLFPVYNQLWMMFTYAVVYGMFTGEIHKYTVLTSELKRHPFLTSKEMREMLNSRFILERQINMYECKCIKRLIKNVVA